MYTGLVSNSKGEIAEARLPVSNIYESPVHLCDIEFLPRGPFASCSTAHFIWFTGLCVCYGIYSSVFNISRATGSPASPRSHWSLLTVVANGSTPS